MENQTYKYLIRAEFKNGSAMETIRHTVDGKQAEKQSLQNDENVKCIIVTKLPA